MTNFNNIVFGSHYSSVSQMVGGDSAPGYEGKILYIYFYESITIVFYEKNGLGNAVLQPAGCCHCDMRLWHEYIPDYSDEMSVIFYLVALYDE